MPQPDNLSTAASGSRHNAASPSRELHESNHSLAMPPVDSTDMTPPHGRKHQELMRDSAQNAPAVAAIKKTINEPDVRLDSSTSSSVRLAPASGVMDAPRKLPMLSSHVDSIGRPKSAPVSDLTTQTSRAVDPSPNFLRTPKCSVAPPPPLVPTPPRQGQIFAVPRGRIDLPPPPTRPVATANGANPPTTNPPPAAPAPSADAAAFWAMAAGGLATSILIGAGWLSPPTTALQVFIVFVLYVICKSNASRAVESINARGR